MGSKILFIPISLLVLLSTKWCTGGDEIFYRYRFVNDTQYTVTVFIDDRQFKEGVTIEPGQIYKWPRTEGFYPFSARFAQFVFPDRIFDFNYFPTNDYLYDIANWEVKKLDKNNYQCTFVINDWFYENSELITEE